MASTSIRSIRSGADAISAAGALSNDELGSRLDGLFRQKAAVDGEIVVLLGEVERRQVFQIDGSTGIEAWAVARFGISVPTARALSRALS